MRIALSATLALALLAVAWSAGFFWTWSFTVMPGLATAPPEAAIAAMRAVNANVRSAAFAFVFFGPALLAALVAALAFAAQRPAAAWAAVVALAVYAGGVLFVTFGVNVPLNETLAAAAVAPDTAAAVWAVYAPPWTAWNHLRTAAATLSFAALVAAALALRR